jgi:hypothetical protein
VARNQIRASLPGKWRGLPRRAPLNIDGGCFRKQLPAIAGSIRYPMLLFSSRHLLDHLEIDEPGLC